MKNLCWTFSIVLVGVFCGIMPARAKNFVCGVSSGGVLPAFVDGNVTVPPNTSCTAQQDFTVTGNVSVGAGSVLELAPVAGVVDGNISLSAGASTFSESDTPVTVRGNITGTDVNNVVFANTIINGNVTLTGCVFCRVAFSQIGGNVSMENGVSASFPGVSLAGVEQSTVGGNVTLIDNAATVTDISGNTISGNLVCRSNNPPPSGGGNLVSGNKVGQCAKL